MRYANNFDTNSDGINIQFRGYYDNWFSRDLFEEQISRHDYGRVTLFTTNLAEVSKIGDFCTLPRLKKADLIDLVNELDEWDDWENMTVRELRDTILNANPAMILDDFWESKLPIKRGFTIYNTRGYCQGDSEYVLCRVDDNTDVIDHLFWDSPIYANVDINGEDFDYCNSGLDSYDWDKDDFIHWIMSQVSENATKIREYLEDMIPEHLDYAG